MARAAPVARSIGLVSVCFHHIAHLEERGAVLANFDKCGL